MLLMSLTGTDLPSNLAVGKERMGTDRPQQSDVASGVPGGIAYRLATLLCGQGSDLGLPSFPASAYSPAGQQPKYGNSVSFNAFHVTLFHC